MNKIIMLTLVAMGVLAPATVSASGSIAACRGINPRRDESRQRAHVRKGNDIPVYPRIRTERRDVGLLRGAPPRSAAGNALIFRQIAPFPLRSAVEQRVHDGFGRGINLDGFVVLGWGFDLGGSAHWVVSVLRLICVGLSIPKVIGTHLEARPDDLGRVPPTHFSEPSSGP